MRTHSLRRATFILSVLVLLLTGCSGTKSDGTDSLVLVLLQRGKKTLPLPGIVFKSDDQYAYVGLTTLEYIPEEEEGKRSPRADYSYTIVWKSGSKEHRVKAERVGRMHSTWIFRAPMSELPKPIPLGDAKLEEGKPVELVGCKITKSSGTISFSHSTMESSILVIKGAVTRHRPQIVNPQNTVWKTDSYIPALVRSADKKPLGILSNVKRSWLTSRSDMGATSLNEVKFWGQPEFNEGYMIPISGDGKEIQWQLIVQLEDPYDAVTSATARLQPDRSTGLGRAGTIPSSAQTLGNDAVAVTLTRKTPDSAIQSILKELRVDVDRRTWVGVCSMPKPEWSGSSVPQPVAFLVQVEYQNKSGQTRGVSLVNVWYTPDARDEIPGLDNQPDDVVRLVKHQDGTYHVTSTITRLEDANTPPAWQGELPQPEFSEQSLVARKFEVRNVAGVELSVTPGQSVQQDSMADAAYSPDGKWLYLLTDHRQLRKINADTFQQVASLDTLGSEQARYNEFSGSNHCAGVVISQAGILLPMLGANVVWVVDPETFAVTRAVNVPDLQLVAASPSSTIGFAVGARYENGSAATQRDTIMIDWSSGAFLHGFRGTSTRNLESKRPSLFDNVTCIEISSDGTYVFVSGATVQRFRLNGTELIYEESTPEIMTSSGGKTFVISPDASRISTILVNMSGAYLDGKNFKRRIDDALVGVQGVAVDPKTNHWYQVGTEFFAEVTEERDTLTNFPLEGYPGEIYESIVVSPLGKRFVLIGSSKIYCYDLN